MTNNHQFYAYDNFQIQNRVFGFGFDVGLFGQEFGNGMFFEFINICFFREYE
jgi:hypothetical protein